MRQAKRRGPSRWDHAVGEEETMQDLPGGTRWDHAAGEEETMHARHVRVQRGPACTGGGADRHAHAAART